MRGGSPATRGRPAVRSVRPSDADGARHRGAVSSTSRSRGTPVAKKKDKKKDKKKKGKKGKKK